MAKEYKRYTIKYGRNSLPKDYTQLDYIESSGTQYIDTGINYDVNKTLSIYFDGNTTNDSLNSQYCFGWNAGGMIKTGSNYWDWFDSASSHTSNVPSNIRTQIMLKINSGVNSDTEISLTQGTTTNYTRGHSGISSYTTSPFKLFAVESSSTVYGYLRAYSFKIYNNDTLVRDFIPAKDFKNRIGMYDLTWDNTRCGVKVFDGTENWGASGNYFSYTISNLKPSMYGYCYCTHFKSRKPGGPGDIQVGANTNTTYWFEVSSKPEGVVDVTTWKAWLKQQYDNGTPVTIYYQRTTDDVLQPPFYENRGSGKFIEGTKTLKRYVVKNNKEILPDTYQQLEYIQSSGTQYINTEYKPNSNTKVITKFKTNEEPNGFRWFFNARNENVAGGGFGLGCNGQGYITSDFNDRQISSVKLINNEFYLIEKDSNICKINNITLTNTPSTFSVNYNLPIFTLNNIGTISYDSVIKSCCYYFKIYENNVLMKYLVPAKRKSDNEIGMYDLVGKQFYTNSGTGKFIAGDIIPNIKRYVIKGEI